MEEKHIAAIDLGSSKFALAVAKVSGDNVQVIYYRETPADGIRNSKVFNPMKVTRPLRKAIQEAEEELKIKILQVVVGLPRYSIVQETATGAMQRVNPQEYITFEEVQLLKENAQNAYPLDNEAVEEIYGAVAQSFSTPEEIQLPEDDVIGTLGDSIEGNFKIFIGNRNATVTIDKVFNDLKIAIAKKYFLPDVTAKVVLTQEEMRNGVALVDFGAGVTSVCVYHGGIMRHFASIPFGGKTITNDLRIECGISEDLAENIKKAYGACMPNRLASLSEKVLQIRYDNSPYKEVTVKYISEIIDARAREIIDAVLYEIQESNFCDALRSGIVLTGGGANLTNFANLMKEVSGYNVRFGRPLHLFSASGCVGLCNPEATAAIGMIMAAKGENMPDCVSAPEYVAPEIIVETPVTPVVETPVVDAPVMETPAVEDTVFNPEPAAKPEQGTKTGEVKPGGIQLLWKKLMKGVSDMADQASKEGI
ncbi:MAG: cell division protein FtsA [Bacteroidales bacterium]|nr:cell division protein FtsA [Bacteroidales bacterium]